MGLVGPERLGRPLHGNRCLWRQPHGYREPLREHEQY